MKYFFGWAFVVLIAFAASPRRATVMLELRYAAFDPVKNVEEIESGIDPDWRSQEANALQIIQFDRAIEEQFFAALKAEGVRLYSYLPNQSYLARIDTKTAEKIRALEFVRWVGAYHPVYKMEKLLSQKVQAAIRRAERPEKSTRLNLLAVSVEEKAALVADVKNAGGKVVLPENGSLLLVAELTDRQVRALAHSEHLVWMDLWSAPENDVNNARTQGGAAALETLHGYTGQGIRGHVMEGVYATHPDFAAKPSRQAPIAVGDATPDSHGSQTFGIVFGDGRNNSLARGLLPDAQGFYTNNVYLNATNSRIGLVRTLMNDHRVMFQTASWGTQPTTLYTADSAAMDQMIFELDLPITQSQSNTGTRQSRPQAWAKNVISVGALDHRDNADPSDDRWRAASIGPAEDGRIKPDLCAYYDATLTTAGETGYNTGFGGTSGATPTVAGHLGLVLQMWTNGIFGNTLRDPTADRFTNRPHFTTAKALLINSARQYPFDGANHNLKRVHQGWGFPNVKDLYDFRARSLIVNETEVLATGDHRAYSIPIAGTETELKATLVYADPPGLPSATLQLVNNLDLKVTGPDGSIYWGNNGLLERNYSLPSGGPNTVDPVENVFVSRPAAGVWIVEVLATRVNADSHLETPAVDADFALVTAAR